MQRISNSEQSNNTGTAEKSRHPRIIYMVLLPLALLGCLSIFSIRSLAQPPNSFPVNSSFTILPGANLHEVATDLKANQYIRSENLFYFVMNWYFDPRTIKASTYFFNQPLTMRELGSRITIGEYGQDLIRITLVEGERASVFAARIEPLLPAFTITEFVELAEAVEGKLFPETYFVPSTFTAQEMFDLLTATYVEQMATYQFSIAAHDLSESEVIILASIIEREANTKESKRMVASILLQRLRIGMPLQADASIEYVLGKPLNELTPDDLDIDTPYNTYLYRGLPPTPIGNPGLDAIEAVLDPLETNYLFYITGTDGNFYYAVTYDEHQRNIAKHLR